MADFSLQASVSVGGGVGSDFAIGGCRAAETRMACIKTNVLEVVIPGLAGAYATSVAVNGFPLAQNLLCLRMRSRRVFYLRSAMRVLVARASLEVRSLTEEASYH